MIARKYRIKKKKEFEKVFTKGVTFASLFFVVKAKKNSLSFSRFAFVAPLKISKSAVVRNQTKRKTREAVYSFFPLMEKPMDVIFIARKNLQKKEMREVREEVEKALRGIKLI